MRFSKGRFRAINCGLLLLAAPCVQAGDEVRWIDGRDLPVEGRAFAETKSFYDRLPAEAEGRVTPAVWSLSHHTAGMLLRFRTDSRFVKLRWDLQGGDLDMANMPRCGKSGFDVYRRAKDGRWKLVRACAPSAQHNNLAEIGWTPGEECMVNFPLYNGVKSMAVGIDAKAKLEPIVPKTKPIVWYGVSTTQGASASRPGMAFPAIVSRRLDIPHVNLGFSGAGRMEMEMCDYVARLEASVYVVDTPGNLNLGLMKERYEKFLRELHRRRPDTPIVIAGERVYSSERTKETPMNLYLTAMFERIGKEPGWKLYYVRSEEFFPTEIDETPVDSPGGHPSDLGMIQLADAYQKAIAAALKIKF